MAATLSVDISANWQWRERDSKQEILAQAERSGEWIDCVSFPSEIHVELIHAKKIPDPYVGFNEHQVQWVGEREWLYRTVFDSDVILAKAELIFEGLDTFCAIYLNGKQILKTDNQFTPYTVALDPSTDLKPKGNTLLLHFLSAKTVALDLERVYGKVRAGSVNLGHPSRVYVRKAQYDWRWDWGPELMTAGPYRPITLKTYQTSIENVHARASVSSPLVTAATAKHIPTLGVDVKLSGLVEIAGTLVVLLRAPGSAKTIKEETFPASELSKDKTSLEAVGVVQWRFEHHEVDLWWPVGYGAQSLYEVEVILKDKNGVMLDVHKQRIGFRTVELVQEPFRREFGEHAVLDRFHHGEGTSFYFRVNNIPIFIGGSNWVPADSFLTTITPDRYRAWLQLLKDGNQNMVRIWGGGIYEPDCFYDICDELGILVWQDFQFACGVYPAHDEFVKNVRVEAEANVTRLRHHPSIAIWCGNNEDYQQVLQWGGIDDLPARKIYEEVLPDVISRLTNPPAPYHRGSPYGGKGWDTSDPTVGDVHQWNVWAGQGLGAYYQNYDELGGRFVSEFGMPAFPDPRTIEYWLEDGMTSEEEKQKLRYSQSKSMQQHNRAGSHERRFAVYMNENFRITSDFSTHVYLTQLLQSEAVSYAYRVWRREWRGHGREYNGGAIVWQLNDCWPVTSWAIADYFLRPKPVFYTIAREMATYTVGIQRKVQFNREHDRPKQFYEFGAFQALGATIDVWGTNSSLDSKEVLVELNFYDLYSPWTHSHLIGNPVTLTPNSSTEILTNFQVFSPPLPTNDGPDPTPTNSFSVIVSARFLDPSTSTTVIARTSNWPEPYRMLDLPTEQDVKYSVTLAEDENEPSVIWISAVSKPVKAVVLSVDPREQEGEVKWSDNALDLSPGDDQVVYARGLKTSKLTIHYLGGEFVPIASGSR